MKIRLFELFLCHPSHKIYFYYFLIYLLFLLLFIKYFYTCKCFLCRNKHTYLPTYFIKKETLAQIFSCEFCEISKNNFFYSTNLGYCFCIKFCKSYKEACEGTSSGKFLQSCHFNIKWRKGLLKRKDQKQPQEAFY